MQMKRCSNCGKLKNLSTDYYVTVPKNRPPYPQSRCKECVVIAATERNRRVLSAHLSNADLTEFVVCAICGCRRKSITIQHTRSHGLSLDEYRKFYPDSKTTSAVLSKLFKNKCSSEWKRGVHDNNTEAARKHCKVLWSSPEFRLHVSNRMREYHENLTVVDKAIRRSRHRKWLNSKEGRTWRRAMSVSTRKRISEDTFSGYRNKYYYNKCLMRSRYEVLFAFVLDYFNISYLYEPFILYLGRKGLIPDFVLWDNIIIEVKGKLFRDKISTHRNIAHRHQYKYVLVGYNDALHDFYGFAYKKCLRGKDSFTFDKLLKGLTFYAKSTENSPGGKTTMLRHLECVRDELLYLTGWDVVA